jgi:hypothetical protein
VVENAVDVAEVILLRVAVEFSDRKVSGMWASKIANGPSPNAAIAQSAPFLFRSVATLAAQKPGAIQSS